MEVIILIIKMQLEEHIFLEGHSNLMHMSFQNEKLGIEIVVSHLYGLPNMIGLNIASRWILCFAFCATCSKERNTRAKGRINLLWLEKLECRRKGTFETLSLSSTQRGS